MKIFNFLQVTKIKIITTVLIFGVFFFMGGIFWKDIKYQVGSYGYNTWRNGPNPFFGLMPWRVYIPLSLVISYLISCISIFLFKKRK